MMATLLTPSCLMSVCLVAVEIVAKATRAVPFRSGKHEIGVLSWGYGRAQENFRGVYSRLSGAED
jgi:hypothetical protein